MRAAAIFFTGPQVTESIMSRDSEKLGNREAHAAEASGNEKVGYCKPPKHSQFRPGQSGNPLGRPKGTLSFAPELIEELLQTITAPETASNITNKRAIVKNLVAAAKEEPHLALSLIIACAKLSRSRASDSREEDDAFVAKLAERETQADEKVGDTISSQIEEEKQ
jgi:Family of unknown function (DUF5681)